MSPAGESEDLQFQKAEFTGRTCTFCKSAIGDTYYQIQGRDACATCAHARTAAQTATDSGGKMMKALLWGGGAAIAGSLAFAFVAYLGFQLAILSIGIGWLVGTAIKKGTQGHTSRKYQIIAVLLTYLAIATSYVPLVIAQVITHKGEKDKDGKTVPAAPAAEPEAKVRPAATGGSPGLALLMALGLILVLPFVDAFSSMPGGLLTLLIVFFGLQQAWKQTAPDDALIAGPYPNTA